MRVRIISIVFLLFLIAIVGRLFYWQIWQGTSLAEAAALQRDSVRQIPAQRGEILANDGNILVGNQAGYLLFASTVDLKEKIGDVVAQVGPIVFAAEEDARNQLRLN